MKFTFAAVALSLFLADASAESKVAHKRHLTKAFLEAMNEPIVEAARKKGRAQHIRKLQHSLLRSARKLEEVDGEDADAEDMDGEDMEGDNMEGDNMEDNMEEQDVQQQQYEANPDMPFDLSSFAFKYTGCSAIKTYDTERGEETGNPMVTDNYAVFRLCPSGSCSAYSSSGCGSNYGQYVIEMETYLNYLLNYYDNRLEQYCDYCDLCSEENREIAEEALEACYYKQQQYQQAQQQAANQQGYANAYGGNRELANNNVDQNAAAYGYYDANNNWVYPNSNNGNANNGYANANGMYQCADGTECDLCTYKVEQEYGYCDDRDCADYDSYCAEGEGDEENQNQKVDVAELLECREYQNQYGQSYYVGPHCGSDSFTITLAVFSDENCVNYVGGSSAVASLVGDEYTGEEDIFSFPKACISCDGAEQTYNEQAAGNVNNMYGDFYVEPELDQYGVIELCNDFYEGSARCHQNMDDYATISAYLSEYELDLETKYCNFIHNLANGNYDDSGEVTTKNLSFFNFADWKNVDQYKELPDKLGMSTTEALGVAASALLCVILALVACFTSGSVRRPSAPWAPKRAEDGFPRQNSGIVLGRSRSGPGAAPLI